MKYFQFSAMLALVTSLSPLTSKADADCPRVNLGETAEDCPWAFVVRGIEKMDRLDPASIDSKLKELLPKFQSRIQQESRVAAPALPLWGTSVNYDEGAKAIIIRPEIVDYLLKSFRVAPREDRVVHAGVEHTYGYLLTNLVTPFGYKRARWVRDDLETGFGLKRGTLGPNAIDGGFLSNVSYFAGSIAFRNEPENLEILDQLSAVSPELKKFNYSKLAVKRLVETIRIGERMIEIRTDFVPFLAKTSGTNAEALIYSIRDFTPQESGSRGSSRKPVTAKLISMFPVAADFSTKALDPKGLGESKPIVTRYNAWVPGISGAQFTGTRCVMIEKDGRVEKKCD